MYCTFPAQQNSVLVLIIIFTVYSDFFLYKLFTTLEEKLYVNNSLVNLSLIKEFGMQEIKTSIVEIATGSV